MSQKLLIGLIGVVVILAGVWYLKTNMSDTNSAATSQSNGEQAQDGGNGVLDSFKNGAESFAQVLRGGQTLQCQFSGTDPNTNEISEGTIFIAGESFRLDVDTTVEGKETKVHMIQHEKIMYMWSEDEETMPGIKLDVSGFEETDGMEAPESPMDWLEDEEANVDYTCAPWASTSDSFAPPSGVEFYDMLGGMGEFFGNMMQEGMLEGSFETSAEGQY